MDSPMNAAANADDLLVDRVRMPYELDSGPASRARIGLAALSGNQITEHEFRRILKIDGVEFYTSRIADSVNITPETLRDTEQHLADAVSLILPGIPLDVVAFTCTSATIVNGEDRVFTRIRQARPDASCTTPITAALAAAKALGLRRIAMLTPYVPAINTMMRDYIQARNFEVPVVGSFNNGNDHEVARITTQSVCNAVRDLAHAAPVDGVFVSCGSLRLADAIDGLEREIGLPVFSSNHAMAWHCLRLAGITDRLSGLGALYNL
ncbi:MAG: Asp/Glu racemase [Pseudomonadota bacterium]